MTGIDSTEEIRRKIACSERISSADALWLWRNASDDLLRELATTVRGRFHAPHACSYMIMRIINYTNVCVAQCDYCAFYRLPGQEGGYVMNQDQVFRKLDELLELGGDLAAFNGGFNPYLPLDYYCDLFSAIRARYGDALEFYALTIAEFMYLADHAKLDYATTARALPRCRRTLDHGRWLRDPYRRLPPPPQQIQIHSRAIFRSTNGYCQRRPQDHLNHGHRLR